MATYSNDQRDYFKSIIRAALLRDGQTTITELQRILKRNGIHLDRDYIASIVKKVLAERTHYIQTRSTMKGEYAALVREKMKHMWDIMINPYEYSHNRIAAAHELQESFEKLMNVDANMNILKGAFATPNPTFVISEPKLLEVVESMVRFNILPKHAIETLTGASETGDKAPSDSA